MHYNCGRRMTHICVLTRAWFPRAVNFNYAIHAAFSEWSCWRMFIETWPHSEVMICDIENKQLLMFLCCSALHLVSFQTSTTLHPWRKELVLKSKNILQKMKYQRICWRTHYLMFLKTLIVTVKMTVTLLLLEIGKTKLCILYRVTVTVNNVQTKVTMTMKH